jgi:hypothetical protein
MAVTKICTPQWLVDNYLVGVDLTDDNGQTFPDAHFKEAIYAAVAYTEAKYDIVLRRPREFTVQERHDGKFTSSPSWYFTQLRQLPIAEIVSFGIQFGNYPTTNIPASWVHIVSARAGQVQIVPGPEGFRHPYIVGNTPLLGLEILGGRGYLPGWVSMTYRAGFERSVKGTFSGTINERTFTYTPASADTSLFQQLQEGDWLQVNRDIYRVSEVLSDTEVEVDEVLDKNYTNAPAEILAYDPTILQAIGYTAAMPILDTAGDLVLGAGISSQSISIDGISQSISSTAGVENAAYGARKMQYRKQLEDIDKQIRRRYRRMNMFTV